MPGLIFACSPSPHPILLPLGEGILFTLSQREMVAKGRVRGGAVFMIFNSIGWEDND